MDQTQKKTTAPEQKEYWEIRTVNSVFWTDTRPTFQGGVLLVKGLRKQELLHQQAYAKAVGEEAFFVGNVCAFRRSEAPGWFNVSLDDVKKQHAREQGAENEDVTPDDGNVASKIRDLEAQVLGMDD